MNNKKLALLILGFAVAGMASATPISFSNNLKGYAGNDTSVDGAFLGAGGLEVTDTGSNPSVVFDASGANFGTVDTGWGGRNYLRTTETGYGSVSFTAYVTVNLTDSLQNAYFGLGTGDATFFREPDLVDGAVPSKDSIFMQMDDQGWANGETWNWNTVVAGADPGTEVGWAQNAALTTGVFRLEMDYDAVAKQMTFAIDADYAGGAFVADVSSGTFDVTAQSDAFNLGARSSIYLGGGEGITYSDFSVTVIPEPATLGLVASMGGLLLFIRRLLAI